MMLGRLLFGMQMAGSWPTLFGAYLCGACALVPMGLLVGSTARDIRTAPAIANLLFFPMMFLSGSAMPFALLPEGVQRFARLLPTTYLNETYSGVIVRGEGLLDAGRIARRAARDRRRRHRPDVDAVPMGRHRSDSAPIAGDDRDRVLADARRVGAGGAGVSRWATCPARAAIEPGPAAGQVLVLRGATVLDGLGGRIVNARVAIRDHRIAEVSLDDDRVAAAGRRDGRGSARPLSDSRACSIRTCTGADPAASADAPIEQTDGSPRSRSDRDARRRRDVGRVADRQPEGDARAVERSGGRAPRQRRARSTPAPRSPRRAGIRRRCFRSCPGSRSS